MKGGSFFSSLCTSKLFEMVIGVFLTLERLKTIYKNE